MLGKQVDGSDSGSCSVAVCGSSSGVESYGSDTVDLINFMSSDRNPDQRCN